MGKARSRSNITTLWRQGNMEMKWAQREMDWVLLFVPGVRMESYVLPERPSGLKKTMVWAQVPHSLQALTHLAGARHRGLGLPSSWSHRESTHTLLRATPQPNSLHIQCWWLDCFHNPTYNLPISAQGRSLPDNRQEFIPTPTPPPHTHSYPYTWQNLGWFKRLFRFSGSFNSLKTKLVSKAMYS